MKEVGDNLCKRGKVKNYERVAKNIEVSYGDDEFGIYEGDAHGRL